MVKDPLPQRVLTLRRAALPSERAGTAACKRDAVPPLPNMSAMDLPPWAACTERGRVVKKDIGTPWLRVRSQRARWLSVRRLSLGTRLASLGSREKLCNVWDKSHCQAWRLLSVQRHRDVKTNAVSKHPRAAHEFIPSQALSRRNQDAQNARQ